MPDRIELFAHFAIEYVGNATAAIIVGELWHLCAGHDALRVEGESVEVASAQARGNVGEIYCFCIGSRE
jgi:hypothetical protein